MIDGLIKLLKNSQIINSRKLRWEKRKVLMLLCLAIVVFWGANLTVSAGGLLLVPKERFNFSDTSIRNEEITYIGSLGEVSSKTSGSTLQMTTTRAVSQGEDIVLALATDPNANMVVSITDTAGNDYEEVSLVINTGQIRTYLFVAFNANAMASGSTITIDKNVSVTARVAVAALFNGLADSGALDQTASATGSSTSPFSGATLTTTQNYELIIGVIGTEGPVGDDTGTWSDSFSSITRTGTTEGADDTNISVDIGYRIVVSTGAYTASKDGISSRDWGAIIATFGQLNIINFNILLGRPTDDSLTVNVIPNANVDFKVEYGDEPGVYTLETTTFSGEADIPTEFTFDGLSANSHYYYHIAYYDPDTETWLNDEEHSFMTQRAPGESFVFTIISDSHFGQYGGQTADEVALYEQTIQNVIADQPDFHIDLGDTFAMDPSPLGTGMTEAEANAAYYIQRPYLAPLTHSTPFLFVLGNHENEEGWNFDDTFAPPDQSLAIVGMKYRKLYYPNPIPNDFYTGNTDPLDEPIGGDLNREDYYAWEWGDALFVVLDPFHYSMTWPNDEGTSYGGEGQDGEVSGDRWDWSLGIQQYLWLKETLETSTAKYKFVFSHHVTGGSTQYGRGGQRAAPYFEWGGYNADGPWGWDIDRPASEGWDVPVQQLMIDNGVDIYFHGHDHIYAYELVDGIPYVECPKPDDTSYDWTSDYVYGYSENLYPDAIEILPNSGHIRVNVTPDQVTVEYVRSYLPGDGENGIVAHSFTIEAAQPMINFYLPIIISRD